MSRLQQTGALAVLLLAVSIGSCSDDDPDTTPSDGSVPDADSGQTDAGRDGGMDASTPDATTPGNDANTPSVLASCIERPTDLPRPPTGKLSCDLLPPGLTLSL